MFTFGNEVAKSKPSPDIFIKTCEKMKENPRNCIVFEDSEAGIEAASRANIEVICIPDIKQPVQKYIDKTKAVYNSLSEAMESLGFLD